VLRASEKRRVFVAGFSHETNTFHPIRTTGFSFSKAGDQPLAARRDADLVVVPGIVARPNGGGTIEEKPCREAMNRVLDSLRSALPVDAVFLRLHGAMYAEGIAGECQGFLVFQRDRSGRERWARTPGMKARFRPSVPARGFLFGECPANNAQTVSERA
jgi:microcystin degradation protein MlrC